MSASGGHQKGMKKRGGSTQYTQKEHKENTTRVDRDLSVEKSNNEKSESNDLENSKREKTGNEDTSNVRVGPNENNSNGPIFQESVGPVGDTDPDSNFVEKYQSKIKEHLSTKVKGFSINKTYCNFKAKSKSSSKVGGFVTVGITSTPIFDSDEASLTLSFTYASLSLLNSSYDAVLPKSYSIVCLCFLLILVFLTGTLVSSSFTTSSFPFVIEASSMSIFCFFEVSCSSCNPCLFTLDLVSMGGLVLLTLLAGNTTKDKGPAGDEPEGEAAHVILVLVIGRYGSGFVVDPPKKKIFVGFGSSMDIDLALTCTSSTPRIGSSLAHHACIASSYEVENSKDQLDEQEKAAQERERVAKELQQAAEEREKEAEPQVKGLEEHVKDIVSMLTTLKPPPSPPTS
ncbi:hypothetical protein Tco_1243519 [Tanacetum coccineum]